MTKLLTIIVAVAAITGLAGTTAEIRTSIKENTQMKKTIANTFLEAHDFSGKTIIPFFTSGGSGAGKTLDYLKPSAPKATFAEPKNLTRATEADIREWCKR